jgi:hypothetical protein
VWHVSLSSPVVAPLSGWTEQQHRRARETATALLRGRGEGPDIWTEGERVLHLRRRLADVELGELPRGWLAVPAIDRG